RIPGLQGDGDDRQTLGQSDGIEQAPRSQVFLRDVDQVLGRTDLPGDADHAVPAQEVDLHPVTRGVHDLSPLLLETLPARRASHLVRWAEDFDDRHDVPRPAVDDLQEGFADFLLEPGGREDWLSNLHRGGFASRRERRLFPSRASGYLDIRDTQL